MIQADKILLTNIITEKAADATSSLNQYVFKVSSKANKISISQAIRKTFGVNPIKVNVINVKAKAKRNRMRRGQVGYKAGYKKAIVTLKAGETIDLI